MTISLLAFLYHSGLYVFTELCHKMNKKHVVGRLKLLSMGREREMYPVQGVQGKDM